MLLMLCRRGWSSTGYGARSFVSQCLQRRHRPPFLTIETPRITAESQVRTCIMSSTVTMGHLCCQPQIHIILMLCFYLIFCFIVLVAKSASRTAECFVLILRPFRSFVSNCQSREDFIAAFYLPSRLSVGQSSECVNGYWERSQVEIPKVKGRLSLWV